MKIAFTGYYGFSNYGDDLFAVVCSWAASKYWPDHRASVIGPPVKGADAHFRVPPFLPKSWYSSTGLAGKLSRLSATACAVLANDVIVLAGGSTLASLGSNNMHRVQQLAAKWGVTRLAGIGLSLGPFHSCADEQSCEEFLKRFAYLALRDRGSYDLAVSMDLPYKPIQARDLAGMLPLVAEIEPARPGQPRPLGVALCNYESYVGGDMEIERRRNDMLFEAVRDFAGKRNMPVRVFSLNSNQTTGDDVLCGRLAGFLTEAGVENEVVRTSGGVMDIWQKIGQCSALMSVRLHGGISAYLAGVPFCLIEYHKKCGDFLDDVGQHSSLRLGGEVSSAGEVAAVLERLTENAPHPTLDCGSYVEESKLNFTAAPWAERPL